MDNGSDDPIQFLFPDPEIPDSFPDFPFEEPFHDFSNNIATSNPLCPSAAIPGEEDNTRSRRRPSGNSGAVRKYREKKKAHVASLESEVKKLRAANQQLMRRLQGHAALEAEVVRLRSLLLDVRAKVDAEIGAYPCRKRCNNSDGSVCTSATNPARCVHGTSEDGTI